jgi:hypothetical protein
MADSTAFRQLFESRQVVLVEPQRDLFGARRSNLQVEILQLVIEFLDAVTTPELPLGSFAPEPRHLFTLETSHPFDLPF